MMVEYSGTKIATCPDVYEPAEDTFLLLDSLPEAKMLGFHDVLEVGTGTGIVGIHAAKSARHVDAVDVNPNAIRCARKNAEMNNAGNINVFESDLFSKVAGTYDFIIFNAPYLPSDASENAAGILSRAWDGGPDGRSVTDRFIAQAPTYLKKGGSILLVDSSRAEYKKSIEALSRSGFSVKTLRTLSLFFEELVVILAKKSEASI